MGAKEVAAGASWLDENFPGWEREIDLGTLDITSCQECVLGQSLRRFVKDQVLDTGFGIGSDKLYDQYRKGILTSADELTIRYSFSNEWHNPGGKGDATINEPLWRELIKERFNTGNLSDI